MLLTVGARFITAGLGENKYYMHVFFCIFFITLNGSFGCPINETEICCHMSKEFATVALPESLVSRLQMSGGPSNSSRISATPVTVWEAAESAQSKPLGTASWSKNAFNEIWQCLCEKLPAKPVSRENSQTQASTQDAQAPKGSTADGWQQACTTGKMSTTPWCRTSGTNSVHGWKAIHHQTSPQSTERQELAPRLPARQLSSSTAKFRSLCWARIFAHHGIWL